jgi:hypothetical protein
VKILIAAAAGALAASSVSALAEADVQSDVLTAADLQDDQDALWQPIGYFDPVIDEFVADAERVKGADDRSRAAVAFKYGLSRDAFDATTAFLRNMSKHAYDRDRRSKLRSQALHVLSLSKRAPIALMFVAGVIAHFDGDCPASDVASLMKGSLNTDRDLWAVANGCANADAMRAAIDGARASRPALLYIAMNWTAGDPSSELAAADMLLRPKFLMQVDEQHRTEVHAEIARDKIAKLLDLGLLRDALAFGDSLSPEVRARALQLQHGGFEASIGGFRVKTAQYSDWTAVDYAAALALAGRTAEAHGLLDQSAPPARRKEARDCLEAGKGQCGVGEAWEKKVPLGALVVDQLLDDPGDDPYVLMEMAAAGTAAPGERLSGGAVTEAACRLLSRKDEQQDCQNLRDAIAAARSAGPATDEDREFWASVQRAGGPPFDSAKARYSAGLELLGPAKPAPNWTRVRVDPAPVPFQELPIPAADRTKKAPRRPDPRAFAPLPQGYTLVRAERSGSRAIAISLSQRFDPDGEVTAGGYWVHLSDDGGKTWQPPLYTGLAEHFPYVVAPSSNLPMIDGDRLHLAVSDSLIDTSSISYPPVGTRLRRERRGIYLDIPISELRKDSDGDGISDIAAHHLLLDGAAANARPYIVGRDANCSGAPDAEKLARLAIVKKVLGVEARELIEPAGSTHVLIGGWRRSEPDSKPPIFLRGNSDDYRCIATDRLMIVYADADQDRLRKFSPDFQLVELPPIRWNRDRTRGFIKWNMGWAGGTYRLTRSGDEWKLESIAEWIS